LINTSGGAKRNIHSINWDNHIEKITVGSAVLESMVRGGTGNCSKRGPHREVGPGNILRGKTIRDTIAKERVTMIDGGGAECRPMGNWQRKETYLKVMPSPSDEGGGQKPLNRFSRGKPRPSRGRMKGGDQKNQTQTKIGIVRNIFKAKDLLTLFGQKMHWRGRSQGREHAIAVFSKGGGPSEDAAVEDNWLASTGEQKVETNKAGVGDGGGPVGDISAPI